MNIIPILDFDTNLISEFNTIFNIAFEKNYPDYFQQVAKPDTYICYKYDMNKLNSFCIFDMKSANIDPKFAANQFIYIHSVSVHPDFRGQGLCYQMIKFIIQKYKHLPMYLHVRTTMGNPNTHAIKCYQKNNFQLIDCIFSDREDGPNSVMIRYPQKYHKTKKYSKKKKRSNKKKKYRTRK